MASVGHVAAPAMISAGAQLLVRVVESVLIIVMTGVESLNTARVASNRVIQTVKDVELQSSTKSIGAISPSIVRLVKNGTPNPAKDVAVKSVTRSFGTTSPIIAKIAVNGRKSLVPRLIVQTQSDTSRTGIIFPITVLIVRNGTMNEDTPTPVLQKGIAMPPLVEAGIPKKPESFITICLKIMELKRIISLKRNSIP